MALNSTDQPVVLGGTVAGTIQAAGTIIIGSAAVFFPALTAEKAAALIGAFNAIVMVVTTLWQQRRAWAPSTVAAVAVQAAATGDAKSAVEAHA